jgi:hypothetical protein
MSKAGIENLVGGLEETLCFNDGCVLLEGLLLRSSAGRCKLVTEHLGFEFNTADVVSVEESSSEMPPRYGIAVLLYLRKGAPLLDVFPAEA